jgi:hypothetical protein
MVRSFTALWRASRGEEHHQASAFLAPTKLRKLQLVAKGIEQSPDYPILKPTVNTDFASMRIAAIECFLLLLLKAETLISCAAL